MTEGASAGVWVYRIGFGVAALTVLFIHLLPLHTFPRNWAGPDLLLCVAMCWSVRRPDYLPLALLAVVFLLADFLLQRPPGLWAALALIACSHLQTRARRLRVNGFMAEWLRVSILIVGITLAWRLVLTATLVPVPGVTLSIAQTVLTVLAYPMVVGACLLLPGLRQRPSGDMDRFGSRI